jgi:hypothetical protein
MWTFVGSTSPIDVTVTANKCEFRCFSHQTWSFLDEVKNQEYTYNLFSILRTSQSRMLDVGGSLSS